MAKIIFGRERRGWILGGALLSVWGNRGDKNRADSLGTAVN